MNTKSLKYKMKKIQLFLAFICYVLSFFTVEAKRVDIEKAEKVARSYARTTTRLTAYRDVRLSKTVSRRVSRPRPEVRSTAAQPQDEPMFYVFAMNGNGGFVIVSGDDIAKPVLGYSGDGTYDENNPNLAYWMETLSQEIAGAIENSVSQDEQTKADWEAFESESDSDISAVSQSGGDYVKPLVKTAWSQNEPYNNLCPEVSGTRTVTGCVATAMAQIMKYHEHPATRTVTIPGYTTRKYRINISGIDGTFDYRWDEMTGTYTSSSASTSQAAVAELMYHCGVSVKMDYDLPSVGSAAYSSDIVSALQDYFGYDAGIACHDREYCTYTEWINLLKAEIKANRPVYYSGSSSSSGHAFVCDGYDTGDLFYFNWGWGGSSDGYFEISALNPKSTGIGGNSEGYNQDQKIVTGIQPDKGGQPSIQLGLSRFYTSKTSLNSLTESFFLTAEILMNTGIVSITDVYLGVLLYSHDDSYIDYKTAQKSPGLNFGQYYSSYELLSSYTFPSNLPAGTYKLYPAYSISGEIPAIIPGKNGNKYIIVVVKNDGTVTLSESSSTAPVNAQTPTISVQPQPAVYPFDATATALSVTANVTDGGVLSYQWYNNAADNNTGGLGIDGATSANYTPPTNTTGTVYYYVKVTNTNTGADITGSQTAVITSSTAAITVNKASQSAPGAPTFAGKTATGITLNTISGNVEYSKDGQIWQDSPVFDNLTPNTAYTFYARYKETGTHTASVSSGPSETITTDKATLSGKVMVSGTVVFGETLTAVTSALKSEPAVENLGTISYQWKRDGSEITGATGSTCTLVQEDIAAIITVTVTTDNTQGSVDSEATTPVAKAQQAAPGPPLLASKTATSVTLNATQSNVEYSIDGVNWQDSPVFDGLSPDTYYTFYMRTKETATHNISPASEGLTVVTDLSTDAELVSLMINGNPVSIADNELNYQATCDENSVTLNIEPSIAASVTVTVGEVEYQSNQSIPLSGDLTEIRINIVSQDKKTLNEYILTVANPFDANRALFKRWDDVVAVNRNRNSNISGVRWHINGETEVSQEWYIQITGEYYAEINIADKWRWVCGNPETISGKLTAYPNPVPAGENLTLKLPVNFTGGYMDVISLAGSTVKRKLPLPDTTNVLSVADWMPGIYLLNIVAPDGCRETIKIVISD
jgi:hypothetical protein